MFRKKKRRAGFTLVVPLVILILGGLFFLGLDSPESQSATGPVKGVQTPTLAESPKLAQAPAEKTAQADEQKSSDAAKSKAAGEKKAEKKKRAAPHKQTIPVPPNDNLWLTVPKMGRYNDYVANTSDPAAMDQGAVKLPSTGFPWQNNANTYIAAHVLGYRGTGSLYQFAKLPDMTYGDVIYLTDSNGTTYTYQVTQILVVTPYDNWVTYPVPGRNMVTLQTCIDPPTYDERLIVRADRIDVQTA